MQFKKPELIPLLFIIASTFLLSGLGAWQVQRLAWKNALIAQVDAAQRLPTLNSIPADTTGLEFRKVELEGQFLHDNTFRLAGGKQGEGPGFFLLTPFKLSNGQSLLVNRGFSPENRAIQPSGQQIVTGILRPTRQKRFFSPENQPDKNLWFYEDIGLMSQLSGIPLLPLVVEATGERKPGVYPIPNPGKAIFRNDHLSYAITWFGLAIIGIIMFVFYLRIPKKP